MVCTLLRTICKSFTKVISLHNTYKKFRLENSMHSSYTGTTLLLSVLYQNLVLVITKVHFMGLLFLQVKHMEQKYLKKSFISPSGRHCTIVVKSHLMEL